MKHVTHFQAAAVTNLTCVQQGWCVNHDGAKLRPKKHKLGCKKTNKQQTATADHSKSTETRETFKVASLSESITADRLRPSGYHGYHIIFTFRFCRSTERTCRQVWLRGKQNASLVTLLWLCKVIRWRRWRETLSRLWKLLGICLFISSLFCKELWHKLRFTSEFTKTIEGCADVSVQKNVRVREHFFSTGTGDPRPSTLLPTISQPLLHWLHSTLSLKLSFETLEAGMYICVSVCRIRVRVKLRCLLVEVQQFSVLFMDAVTSLARTEGIMMSV